MSRYTGPRVKRMRALGLDLPGLSRKSMWDRPYPPGVHGPKSARRRKMSDFKKQLLEKQKSQGSVLAEARNIYGLCLIELTRYEDAIVVLRESAADELNRAPHLAWGNLGLAQFHLGEYQETVKSTMEAIRIQPRFCVGYYTMARALWHLQQLEDAERALVSALEADPSCSDSRALQGAWRLRGEVRARLGHGRDAIADLERCVELDPYSNEGQMCQTLLGAER